MFRKFLLSPYSKSCRIIYMGSKDFLLRNKHIHLLNLKTLLLPSDCRENSRIYAPPKHFSPIYQSCTPYSAMPIRTPIDGVDVGTLEKQLVDQKQLMILKEKLEKKGIDGSKCTPGQHSGLICPSCKGGASREKSLSLNISEDGAAAKWTCSRATCRWKGKTRAFAYSTKNKIKKAKKTIRVINEKSLELEPLGNELLAYFAERMISEETLQRNGVMQKQAGPFQIAIAFPYRRNGELVSCKYRNSTKRFWQEASTEKIFYGLDDIEGASDVIIVEGEIDKLAMEEAGFKNCVSVPDGAPPKASNNVRRRGVGESNGPKRITLNFSRMQMSICVLMYMGPNALREVIEKAELYPIRGLFNFQDYFDEIDDYNNQTLGYELGVSTGWMALNDLYNVVPGELAIVTGVPNSGKIDGVDVGTLEKQLVDQKQLMILKEKLEKKGIDGSKCTPGQHSGLICPSCKGGASREKSLSLNISEDGAAAKWTCSRATCRWKGKTRAFAYVTMKKMKKVNKTIRAINEKSLELEPLGNKLLAYFAEHMISEETLQRNGVKQKKAGRVKVIIAFPYRRNGELVSCKYCDVSFTKRYWQEASTERIFYGLDDIKGASDVIIVEGEMDKLAMEEAGFKNCVSVPNGAPPKASNKELPSEEEDTGYKYVWNCRDYLDKASRIILATDGDKPGQALAEELARRVGKERCWRVEWPKKDEVSSFNDANEVLMNLGADAVRDAIDKAKSYHMQNVD
ncbi:hypothetical protein ACS0TY_019114 [Phlomoides rotata]